MEILQQLGAVLSNNVPPVEPTGQGDRIEKHVKNISGGGK